MSWEKTIEVFAERSDISEHLEKQIARLTAFLEEIISKQENDNLLEQLSSLPQRCAKAFEQGDLDEWNALKDELADKSIEEIVQLLRLYTVFFHLVNSMEQHEITRINRERAKQATIDQPRTESIADIIHHLKEEGYSYDHAFEVIQSLDIQPTITAHPTEARRRSILVKQQDITAMVSQLNNEDLTPAEIYELQHEVLNEISLLLSTDEVRSERLTVEDEVENGLFYFPNSIWKTVPQIYSDIKRAFENYYDKSPAIPCFINYRSWIGSDRDGNPNVTSDVTWETVLEHRGMVLDLYIAELKELRRYLSVSDHQVTIPEELGFSLETDEQVVPLSDRYMRRYRQEPYRRKISHIIEKLRRQREAVDSETSILMERAEEYNSGDFIEELRLVKRCLKKSELTDVSEYGKVVDLINRAETFGFHLASLDIRQHSGIHEQAVGELLQMADVADDYAELPEQQKIELLTDELVNPRPLNPVRSSPTDTTQELLEVFDMIEAMQQLDPDMFGGYIISMTHGVSDMLEVLILAKEAGLWSYEDGEVTSELDLVPLFETIEDLENCGDLMEFIFEDEIYYEQLKARDYFQEIMLGYSDSNKDGGYWMANWALQKAQHNLGRVCRNHEIDFRLFHGRGGTVGRGGGRSNQAILALPPIANNGRIRFTEQGEVISFRYLLPSITRRHLEQIVNAMVRVTIENFPDTPMYMDTESDGFAILEKLAHHSMEGYRALIDHDDFWNWYTGTTPIEHISRLPIASRPVSRGSAKAADFDNLRAIPWVFAWTQLRYNVPGWYGTGYALQKVIEESDENLELLRDWYESWTFFKTLIDNAQREIARTDFHTAQAYIQEDLPDFHSKLKEDHSLAREYLKEVTGYDNILDNRSVIQKSIQFRNPFTYPLNLMQVELLSRWRDCPEEDEEKRQQLRHAIFVSINGIAAAMQSTG